MHSTLGKIRRMSTKNKKPPIVKAIPYDEKNSFESNAELLRESSSLNRNTQKSSSPSSSHQPPEQSNIMKKKRFIDPDILGAKRYLQGAGWPLGLQEALIKSIKKLPYRYFICDDSGSMLTADGHKVMGKNENTKIVSCTRWSELAESLRFHAELAIAAQAPSEFRLINLHKPVMVGTGETDNESLEELYELFDNGPAGQTPICHHINEVIKEIQSMKQQLLQEKKKVAVIISTDGEATDGDIAETMKPLQDLPVWVVVRICTDEDKIVSYWNDIDEELELEIDVLDDFSAEGAEVHAVNSWMSYGQSMHQLREFGAIIKECDLLDESTLSSEQILTVIGILIGDGNSRQFPHPEVDWKGFLEKVNECNNNNPKVFDPMTSSMKPWININNLCKTFKKSNTVKSSSCTIS